MPEGEFAPLLPVGEPAEPGFAERSRVLWRTEQELEKSVVEQVVAVALVQVGIGPHLTRFESINTVAEE